MGDSAKSGEEWPLQDDAPPWAGGAEEAALRRYLCLGPGDNSITRQRFTEPEMAASLGLTSQELEIIFTALDADCDDVITLTEMLEQWPKNEEAGAGAGAVQTDQPEQGNESSVQGEGSLVGSRCSEDNKSRYTSQRAVSGGADDSQRFETMFRAVTEDRTTDRDGGCGHHKGRRRSSVLLHIFDSRATTQPLIASIPSASDSPGLEDIKTLGDTLDHNETVSPSSVSSSPPSLTASPTSPTVFSSPCHPPILSPLSPRRLVDVFPHSAKTSVGKEGESNLLSPGGAPCDISHNDNDAVGNTSAVSTPPTSPTSPTTAVYSNHKAAKCDHSCVHPSKLTLTDLMASSWQESMSESPCISQGGCKDTHKHVRRKIRPGPAVSDQRSPLVADTSLQVIVPKQRSQNQSLVSENLGYSVGL
ncbi:hypothetical protein EGW08_015471 [Elysia chlorotica]|uniref:EF-hand domain-containing protein n=1 Tax=Elysia chlorotica TaxID=188477 RepID=A0A433T5E5_ELYCH|nr:hypothetical protein EGW08_015471 [Elysia chlorotica]